MATGDPSAIISPPFAAPRPETLLFPASDNMEQLKLTIRELVE